DLARRLLIDDDEAWTSPETYARKTQWQDLLGIPFLLHQLRRMAEEPGKLDGLHNRHAIYREAIQRMVDDGIQKLSSTGRGNQIIDVANVERVLGQMAWDMQSAGNHSAVATGPAYRRVREILSDNDLFLAIEHINLTTAGSLLDRPSRVRFAWRHRSFCEYFAGLQLARHYNEPGYSSTLRRLARDPQWYWTFRFALSEAEAAGEPDTRDALARDLIASGNPFLVAASLEEDRLNLPTELAVLTRWLVHHDDEWRDQWVAKAPPPIVTRPMLEILATMFRFENRNSRCLSAAWELIRSTDEPAARRVVDEFLGEFSRIVQGERGKSSRRIAQEFLDGFRHVPPRRSGPDDLTYWDEGGNRHFIHDSFEMARFPVTNELFELFDSHHDRTPWSIEDRCPVVDVTWHQASLFCSWLGDEFALPTEEEWEFACRAGTRTLCWFGNDETELSRHAWCRWNSGGTTHPVGAEGHENPWGLSDMHGNVWEWTVSGGGSSGSWRVRRGGSFNFNPGVCRSSCRRDGDPTFLANHVGFRVCRRGGSPQSSS
ncbi:MAG: formylglycine-generating enzyme family protein, partial [Pirellulaceae bacterium]